MTSDRKIASNRNNAKKSTGPRSDAGRHRSRYNALRHGLAVPIGSNPSFAKDVEELAKLLSAAVGEKTIGEFVRQFAEAEIDLLRIRKIRASQFTLVAGNQDGQSEAHIELAEKLAKLERYERRAFSRRKRALRALTN